MTVGKSNRKGMRVVGMISVLIALAVLFPFVYGSYSSHRPEIPPQARGINTLLDTNRFREAYVKGIIEDLKTHGPSSRYSVKDGSLSFEGTNIFVRNRDGRTSVGYLRHPLGPFKVSSVETGESHYEE